MRSAPSPKPDKTASNRVSAHYSQRFVDRMALALIAATDGERAKRLAALRCKWCWYMLHGRIAGQAFTSWTCAECATEHQHSSTATPKLCEPCARELELCRECCADLDFRHRRTLHRMRPGDRIFKKPRRKRESEAL